MSPSTDEAFVKRRDDAPEGFFAAEAAGLAWLAAATPQGGAAVVRVVGAGRHHITLERLRPAPPSARAADAFGRALAATHRSGAAAFGRAAPGAGGVGWIGPLPLPMTMDAGTDPDPDPDAPAVPWGRFFATHRIEPYLRRARDRGAMDAAGTAAVRRVVDRLAEGDRELTGPDELPARLHGDLWSGNVVWTDRGAVLIDPSAHGGHRESDLAMLALFGAPHLDRVLAAYDEAWPLAPGWRRRFGVHQLFPLLVHAVLFGGGYGADAAAVARRYA